MSNKIGPSNEGRKGGKKEEEEKEDGREEEEEDDEKVSLKRANVLNGGDGGATSDGGDSDEFSDVVVLDPLGREEERPPKQQKQPNISNNSPQKEATPQTNSSISPPIQIQQPQIPEMDQSPVYPNLQQSTHQGSQNQQSWFSSNQLPSFLASSNDENDGNQQQTASASFFRISGELRARLQPWGKFFQPAKFGLPPGLVAIGPRIKYNLSHFLSNYLCLFVVLLIYCILTSFLMLLTLIVLAGLCYTIYQRTQKGPVILGGQEIPPSLLYTLALMICIPLFYMANAGSVMYWVIGTGLFLILAHATFYASEEVPGQEFEVVSVVTA